MKVKLTEEYAATSRLYRHDIMEGHYDPPGVDFGLNDDGERVANLQKKVAQALIEEGICEPLDTEDEDGDGDGGEGDDEAEDGSEGEESDAEDGTDDDTDDETDSDGADE